MAQASQGRVRFGAFELDLKSGELRPIKAGQSDEKVLLREQSFQVLRMQVERAGKIVTRDEIKQRLWPNDTIVDSTHAEKKGATKGIDIDAIVAAARKGKP